MFINFILTLFVVIFFTKFQVVAPPNYGPYNFSFANVTTCNGPKSHDCGKNNFEVYKSANDTKRFKIKIDLQKDCPITHIKITNDALQPSGGGAKNLFNYNVPKPCQHFFFGPTLHKFFNVTEKCVLKKGKYDIDVDLDRITREFLGDRFFYGSFSFKTTSGNSNENFTCTKIILILKEKI